jgi:hypothetical protein
MTDIARRSLLAGTALAPGVVSDAVPCKIDGLPDLSIKIV